MVAVWSQYGRMRIGLKQYGSRMAVWQDENRVKAVCQQYRDEKRVKAVWQQYGRMQYGNATVVGRSNTALYLAIRVQVWVEPYQYGIEYVTSMLLVYYQYGTSAILVWYEYGTSIVVVWYQYGTLPSAYRFGLNRTLPCPVVRSLTCGHTCAS